MSFFLKQTQLRNNQKWYPRSIVVGDPVSTKDVVNRLAEISTVNLGGTVGTFYYTANTGSDGSFG